MKKIISFLIIIAMLCIAVPVFAADATISITLDKTTAKVGEYVVATFTIKDTTANYITLPVHFNAAVVKVADTSGSLVLSGTKTAAQIRNGSAGITPLQVLSGDTDNSGNPLYWNGAIFENPQYPTLDNEKGFYRLMFSNAAGAKEIKSETLLSIKFVVIGVGNADIRMATSADSAYDVTSPNGAVFVSPNPDPAQSAVATAFTVTTQNLTTTSSNTPVTPPPTQTPSGGGSGGTTTVVTPPVVSDTLTYELTEKQVENLLARAADETGNSLNIKIDADAAVTKFIIKTPISAIQKAVNALVLATEFETPIGKIGFDNQLVLANATNTSQFVICTLTATTSDVTIDGVPLKNPDEIKDFDDLTPDHWAYEFVMDLVSKGILNGISDTEFAPDENVTREQFAKMIVGALDIYDESATCDFTDLSADHWAYKYVASAVKAGIIKGYDDGTFGVDKNITREEMAVMVYRTIDNGQWTIDNDAERSKFADENEIGGWAIDAVNAMQSAGIISGMPDGSFAPNDNASRAQAAKIIYGMLGIL